MGLQNLGPKAMAFVPKALEPPLIVRHIKEVNGIISHLSKKWRRKDRKIFGGITTLNNILVCFNHNIQ